MREAIACTKSCRNADVGDHDPLYDALAELARLRADNERLSKLVAELTKHAKD